MTDLPFRIGPYTLVSPLGVGGMAETFVAVRRGPGAFEQRVCLKRVRGDVGRDPEFVRQFMAEAAIVAKLGHSAIAQVLDFGLDGRDYYMALELVAGLDLRELLDAASAGLTFDQTLHVAIEVTSALDFAHRGGGSAGGAAIIHRDVSASNVLVSREGAVKLTDFGIARAVGGPQHTRTGIVKGKVAYMAPEYARSGRFDLRCDLFALGVLLYECTCGERPHAGATELETLELAASAAHTPLCERGRHVPIAFARLVERLLAPDPTQRFQSASLVLDALLALPGSSQQARRDLGVLVTDIENARGSAAPPPLSDAMVAATEPALPTAASSTPAPETRPLLTRPRQSGLSTDDRIPGVRRRGPWFALASALLFASAVLSFGLLRTRAARSSHEPTIPSALAAKPERLGVAQRATEHTAAPAAAESLVLRPTPNEGATQARAVTATPKKPRRAALEVVVLPYGNVVIDGRPVGKAPATLTLEPGTHAVEAKSETGTIRQTVSLAPGEHRQLVLR